MTKHRYNSWSGRAIRFFKAWSVKDPEHWISGGELERRCVDAGYSVKPSNISRRLRELVNEGYLEAREFKQNSVSTVFYGLKTQNIPQMTLNPP